MKVRKEATLFHALIPILFLIVSLFSGIVFFGLCPHIMIILSTIVAAAVGIFMLNCTWDEVEKGIVESIGSAMGAILILMIIGTVIGTWMLSGTVPAMIYYGLQILSPAVFLVAACLICCVVSLATGSSWTTAGTVGIALMGIGTGLGVPLGMSAGAIVSGAYFGDKLSPLSDTTNLAPAIAGTNLFSHIRSMLYTTVPALVIALILYAILGIRFAGNQLDYSQVNIMIDTLKGSFVITPWLLLPPVIVIILVLFKIPALPGLLSGSILGGIFAAIFQGAGIGDILGVAHYGFSIETGVEIVDKLLNRGGLDGMMWTISLILCALSFGGVLKTTGLLDAIGRTVLKMASSTGSLVLSTVLTCIAMNVLAADQYLAIVVPGEMFKDAYKERGINANVLSRVLESSATMTSSFFFWNTCGAFMMATLGVSPWLYIPFAFVNWLSPIIEVIYAYFGFAIFPLDEDENSVAA
ncbi:MAG: Na+/H+ antiporter NhaC [Alkaliphilus sp.]